MTVSEDSLHSIEDPETAPPTFKAPAIAADANGAVPPFLPEKTADRPHKLTLALAIMALIVSGVAGLLSWRSYRLGVTNFLVTHSGTVIHSLRVERVSDGKGGALLAFSSIYQNPSDFSVNRLKSKLAVEIEGKEGGVLPESLTAPDFKEVLMSREEKDFTLIVHPSSQELALADQGDLPIFIVGDVNYEGQDGEYGYSWMECYMLQKLLPCPVKPV
jgi:hypothetical protein